MKLALITDAWHPQVNGVVTTLHELVQALGPLGVTVTVAGVPIAVPFIIPEIVTDPVVVGAVKVAV